jgi:hypothetical protein
MPTRRLFDGASIEIGQVPIVAAVTPAATIVWVKIAGVWKQTAGVFVKIAGTWKNATTFAKESGTWK